MKKKTKKRKRSFCPIAEKLSGKRIGVYIDRAKIRLEEEKHPGYIDALIKMFDDVIGDTEDAKTNNDHGGS